MELTARTDGTVLETRDARDLLKQIAPQRGGRPGRPVRHEMINKWHTLPNTGRIEASNLCSEYMSINDSATSRR